MTHKPFAAATSFLLSLLQLSLITSCSSGVQREPPAARVELTVSSVLSVALRDDADDAEELANGWVRVTGSADLELGTDGGRQQTVGLRFQRVDVPRGATITRAYVQFTADETGGANTRVIIQGQAANSATAFRNLTHEITARPRTSKAVVWNLEPWTRVGAAGAAQRTPDLSAVVQEVVSRSGWTAGNALALVIDGKYGVRAAESYDSNTAAAPRLYVEYQRPDSTAGGQKVRVILDTDLGIDVDDAGALALLHALADRGEADILATVANVNDPYAPGALDAINTYYGRPHIPVGRNPQQQYVVATPWWRKPAPRFIKDLATGFPNDTAIDNLKTAVSVYRRALAAQPDGSVTIVSIGFMQNLADLMASRADGSSSLSGMDLIRRKVKHLVVMGGSYPGSDRDLYLKGGRDISPSPAIRVIEAWPTSIAFTAGNVCGGIATGQTLASKTPKSNPVRAAYTLFFGKEGVGRDSWDLCSVLYAVRGFSKAGDGTYFALSETGKHLTLDMSGRSAWLAPSDPRHKRLVRVMTAGTIAAKLEALITKAPAN